ncbi:MAG: polysaccharide deacetylase family protein [Prevotella sp.]|nr:polysaccharide deacetylase family protein [Prevotella sp.]
MNILTFDIEEWYLEKAFHGNRKERYDLFDLHLNKILDLLEERNILATFFCLGKMATDFPQVVKKIVSKGHEIGCHSNKHVWLNKMSYNEVDEDTHCAIDSLEQLVGKKIKGYRAPAFSIGENNKWAFEILHKYGIEYDASVYPAARDFGGFPTFGYKTPVIISYNGIQIKEFPICMTKLFGKDLAYSGGGYFRMFPLWYVLNTAKKNNYVMTYFHIGDILPGNRKIISRTEYENYFKEKGTLFNRYKRYVKSNMGRSGAFEKMTKFITKLEIIDIEQAIKQIDWNSSEKVFF